MPKMGLWLRAYNLGHRLRVLFIVSFVLPVGYLLYVIRELAEHVDPAATQPVLLSLRVGVPAAALMAATGFAMLYRVVQSLRSLTNRAAGFCREIHHEADPPVLGSDEVERISHYVTDMISELRKRVDDADRYARDLEGANRKLMEMAVVDGLTGLFNHRHARSELAIEIARAARFGHPLSILMMDIDGFKAFNDAHGHLAGDRALGEVGRLVRDSVRGVDIAARYGGEEFMVILPEADLDAAREVGERIRLAVEQHAFSTDDQRTHRITISVGAATWNVEAPTDDKLLIAADTQLYSAKRGGRNRVYP